MDCMTWCPSEDPSKSGCSDTSATCCDSNTCNSNTHDMSSSDSDTTCEDSIPFVPESFASVTTPFKFFEKTDSLNSSNSSVGVVFESSKDKSNGYDEEEISIHRTSVLKKANEESEPEISNGSADSNDPTKGKVVKYVLTNSEKREALLHFMLENFYTIKESEKIRLYHFMMELAKSGVIDPQSLMKPQNPEFKGLLSDILHDVDRDHPSAHPIVLLPSNTNQYAHDFEEVEFLGKGGFGSVVVARKRIDGVLYAVKKVKFRDSLDSVKNLEKVLREVKALAQLDHVNVLRYYHAWIQLEDCDSTHSSPMASPQVPLERKLPHFTNELFGNPQYNHLMDMNGRNRLRLSIQEHPNDATLSQSNGTSASKEFSSDDEMSSASDDDNGESVDSYDGSENSDDSNTLSVNNLPLVPYRYPVCNRAPPISKKRYVMYIQMQYCEGKTLKNFLEKPDRSVNYADNIRLFTQIVAGLHHVHARGLIHRDMKPDNIFLTKESIVKIGDFGLAKQIQEVSLKSSVIIDSVSSGSSSTHTAGIGTRSYMSPEQCNGCLYNEKADVYSLGIILFELFSKFGTQSERARKLQDLKQGIVDQAMWVQYPNVAAFITRMIHPEPDQRPSTSEILESSFLNLFQAQPPDTEIYALLQKQQEEICQLRNRLQGFDKSVTP